MVRQQDWYDPSVIKRVRRGIAIALWAIAITLLYMHHGAIITVFKNFFN